MFTSFKRLIVTFVRGLAKTKRIKILPNLMQIKTLSQRKERYDIFIENCIPLKFRGRIISLKCNIFLNKINKIGNNLNNPRLILNKTCLFWSRIKNLFISMLLLYKYHFGMWLLTNSLFGSKHKQYTSGGIFMLRWNAELIKDMLKIKCC